MRHGVLVALVLCIAGGAAHAQVSGNFQGGSVKVGPDSAACDPSRDGAIRYTAASDTWEFCNGASWVSFSASGETDPQVNTLTLGKWCTTDGSVVNCTGDITDLPSYITFSGDISPASFGSSQNNYNPTGLSTASVIRLTTSSSVNITGLQGGADGRVMTLVNIGSNNITLVNQSGSSSPANRFAFASNIVLAPSQAVTLIYDSTSTRWRAITAAESDPQVGTLTNGNWCTSDGSVVNCTTAAPLTSEDDPQVGTLTNGKWCTTDGTDIDCTSDIVAGSDRQVIFNNAGALAGSSTFIFDASGRLGVGEATPDARLHVAGEVIVANTGLTCSATTEGAIRYDTTDNRHEFCDGGNWVPMDSLYGGGGGDVTPAYFDFVDVTNAATNTAITSNIVLIHGIDAAATIVIGGDGTPEYRICSDATCGTVVQTWTSVSNTIDNGEFLQVRLTSSSSPDTARTANPITVGTLTVNWQVTTIGPKRVFVTSTTYDGHLGGFSGADAKCQARAAAASLSGTYKAWLSSDTETAAGRLVQSPYNYVLTNGSIIANGWSDLTDGSLDATLIRNEFGSDVSSTTAWTGTTSGGAATSNHCNSWTSNDGGNHSGTKGVTHLTNGQWTSDGAIACSATYRLYCFEQ